MKDENCINKNLNQLLHSLSKTEKKLFNAFYFYQGMNFKYLYLDIKFKFRCILAKDNCRRIDRLHILHCSALKNVGSSRISPGGPSNKGREDRPSKDRIS